MGDSTDQSSASPPSSSENSSSSSSPPSPQQSSSSLPSPPPQQSSPPPQQSSPPPSDNSSSSSPAPPPPPSQQSSGDNNKNGNNNGSSSNNNNNNGSSNNNNNNNGSSTDNNNNRNDNNNNNRNDNSPPSPPAPKSGWHSPPRTLGPAKTDNKGESSSAEHLPTLIGVVAAAGLLLAIMVLICVACTRKKKKQPKIDQMQYYIDSGVASKAPGNWTPSQQVQPVNGTWGQSPSPHLPPPINNTSSDLSSNFSGPHGPSLPPPHPGVALGFNQSTFTYDELAAATQGFSQANLLGQGGFGYVHKGVLPNGKEVAVKSLKSGSGQGEREFQAEVEIISRVHHRHLVSLVGYCIAGGQRMLVYEFLPNNTLEFHLYGKGRPVMDWPTRLKIALGSAKGLAYLHEDCHPRIIHRDIKAANILLDFNGEAKVADFGLAKLSQDNYTHVSTRVMGTFGYLAPEYASSGKLTEKSDVFSYGVMLLELITGRRPVDLTGEMEDSLVDWARPLCLKSQQDGNFDELVDPRLENNYVISEMASMVACAAASIRHSARRRPKMSQIVRALEGDVSLDDLTEGVKPGQSTYYGSSAGSSDYDANSYSADMRKFRKLALDSREYPSSEFGATSEYGLNPSASSSDEIVKSGGGNRKPSP